MGKRGMEWLSDPAEPKIYDPSADGGLPSQHPVASARLRLLPIYNRRDGEPGHYVILDRCVGIPTDQLITAAERLRSILPVPVLLFAFEVEIPEVDDQDHVDGDGWTPGQCTATLAHRIVDGEPENAVCIRVAGHTGDHIDDDVPIRWP